MKGLYEINPSFFQETRELAVCFLEPFQVEYPCHLFIYCISVPVGKPNNQDLANEQTSKILKKLYLPNF
jgi:hypothetical protein